jgi:YVTN family beta-propeller protein
MKTVTPLSWSAKILFCVLGFAWWLPSSAEPFAYTTNQGTNTVSVIDTAINTVVDTVPEGNMLHAFGQFMVPLAPACDIQLSQSIYLNGEIITASTLRLTNPGVDPVAMEFKNWLEDPGFAPVSIS